ncbi:glutamine--fructose-6-phosphate transaminase (isomerizing) [bacterium]|nr:glutamine--fructose-6-phosphate transaminase (isomerizing) [bacterium]
MCGIIGYIGKNNAVDAIMDGLRKLEYRGYDSAGLTVISDGAMDTYKDKGRVAHLNEILPQNLSAPLGIGHTRWATHGKPSMENSHPHSGGSGEISIAHNGIIENYLSLMKHLEKDGHTFKSETDSEILAHLIENFYEEGVLLEQAVKMALDKVEGTYGLVVISKREPNKIVAARNSSPMIIGVGENENFIASDATAIIKYTKKIIYLEDQELSVITANDIKIFNKKNITVNRKSLSLDWDETQVGKEGYSHFMLKEIHEQSKSFNATLAGHLDHEGGTTRLGGMANLFPGNSIHDIRRIVILGCGTSWHAGLLGEYYLEKLTGIPVEVEYASEFRYRSAIIDKNTFVIAVSQSGETADTIAAIKEAKAKGAKVFGIVNVVGSSISREVDQGLYIHVGPEIGVASTKAFLSEALGLLLIAIYIGRKKTLSLKSALIILKELEKLAEKMDTILKDDPGFIKDLARQYSNYHSFLYLGRDLSFPIALEGALKLKEISYIHAEGYPAGEMKHGPLALVDPDFPVFFIAPTDAIIEKSLSNIQEIKAREGKIILLTDEHNGIPDNLADAVIKVPQTIPELYPFLEIIPLQLFAYHIAVFKDRDVDKPRNLAKSVTVE